MLRIWKGPEMEGTKVGIMTMFVCSDEKVNSKKIIQLLHENQDVRRLYFGAGKHSFEGVTSWSEIYDYAFVRSIEIVMEIGTSQMLDMIKRYDNLITTFIVVNYDMPFTYNNLQFKTDNNRVVTIYNASSQTSLETLKSNNLFTCDTMLVEEEF